MRQFTKDEFLRLIGRLGSTDPTQPEYLTLLHSIECFDSLANTIDEIDRLREVDLSGGEYPAEQKTETAGDNVVPFTKTDFPAETAEVEDDLVEDDPAEQKEEKTYEASEVRKALVAARLKGVDSTEMLSAFGVDHFRDLDPSKYGALMDALAVLV